MRDALGAVQSVLVLGGRSEIAVAVIDALRAQRCRRVVLAVRDPQPTEPAAEHLRAEGMDVEVVPFDAAQVSTHQPALDAAFAGGDIDLVLLAFGQLGEQSHFDEDARAAAEVATANYVGGVSSGLLVAERMRTQGHGTIVVLSSVAAERPRKTNYVYGSTKAGLDAFAQGLGDALRPDGVHVMVVRPGFVHTRMTDGLAPQPFATTPEAVAAAVIAGLRKGAHTVWAPSVLRWVFAVMRHLPRPVWRRVSNR